MIGCPFCRSPYVTRGNPVVEPRHGWLAWLLPWKRAGDCCRCLECGETYYALYHGESHPLYWRKGASAAPSNPPPAPPDNDRPKRKAPVGMEDMPVRSRLE